MAKQRLKYYSSFFDRGEGGGRGRDKGCKVGPFVLKNSPKGLVD